MYTNDVDFDKSKTTLVKQYKSHIESVFGVNVVEWSRPRDKSENGSHVYGDLKSTVKLSSQFSQESLQKAKNFIESLTVEGEESDRIIEKLSEEELKMLLENKNVIENQSQAVLELIQSSGEICIFGNRKNVSVAKQIIDRMKQGIRKQESCGFLTQDSIDDSGYGLYSADKYYSGEKITETTKTGSNNIILTQRQDSIQADCAEEDFPSLVDSRHFHDFRSSSDQQIDIENNFIEKFYGKSNSYVSHEGDVIVTPDDDSHDATSFSFSEMVVKSLSSSQTQSRERRLSSASSSEDDNDEEVNRIIQDTDNRVKIEFALKLGYSESQIAHALKKLGSNVGQNELLSELIRIGTLGSCSPDNEDDESEETFLSSEISLPFSSYHNEDDASDLRPIVIDGSNVAMSHGNKEIFSCRGIQLAVEWFKQRGHTQITVFVPQWRKETSRPDARITDQEILNQLERDKFLVFTPARRIGGKRVVCYDDRYVLKLAAENDGVVVSNDNYRDLINEKPEFKKVVEERLLMFSFVNDRFMPPDDPLGRHGPSLDNFLSFLPRSLENLPPSCPYGPKKCTYGNKCKYYHPERGNIPQKSVTDKLAEQTKQKILEVRAKAAEVEKKKQIARKPKLALQRTKSLASELPADLVSDKPLVDQDFQKLSLEDVIGKDPEKDDKYKQYNEKLSEYREKLEKAEQEEKLRQEEESVIQRDFELFKPFADHSRSNTPSPSSRLSPASVRPQEQFLSGHLLLAKKLSDEANDSKLRRGTDEHSYTKSPLAATHSQPVISSPQKEVPQQPQHKKLSRQYSLQGAQDPRLKRNVRPQVSFDPNMLHSRDGLHGSSSSPVIHRPLEQSQFYGSEEDKYFQVTNYERESYGHTDRKGNYLLPESYYAHHTTLTRMQSAPEPPLREQQQQQPNARPFGRMMRQNSSSDTQLHIHSGETDTYHSGFFPQSPVGKNVMAKQQDCMSYNYTVQNQNEYIRQSSTMGQYHTQSDPYYSQPSLSQDPRWTFPNLGFQTSYAAGQNTPMSGYQPMPDRSHEFSSLQSRGNQVWQSQHNLQASAYSAHYSGADDPYRQQTFSPERDYNMQSQYTGSTDSFIAQSRPTGVPILGAQSSQTVNNQPIQPTDTRYDLYVRLSALFPEPKVRAVMNQYPYENNAEMLCAYLIGAK